MAMRSRTLPVVALCLLAFVSLQNAFVAAPRQSPALRGMVTAGVVGALPQMANAMDMDAIDVDMGSSLSMSATVEALMLGIVLGTVPITVLGLFVSAWLQFKKGPTLGIWELYSCWSLDGIFLAVTWTRNGKWWESHCGCAGDGGKEEKSQLALVTSWIVKHLRTMLFGDREELCPGNASSQLSQLFTISQAFWETSWCQVRIEGVPSRPKVSMNWRKNCNMTSSSTAPRSFNLHPSREISVEGVKGWELFEVPAWSWRTIWEGRHWRISNTLWKMLQTLRSVFWCGSVFLNYTPNRLWGEMDLSLGLRKMRSKWAGPQHLQRSRSGIYCASSLRPWRMLTGAFAW